MSRLAIAIIPYTKYNLNNQSNLEPDRSLSQRRTLFVMSMSTIADGIGIDVSRGLAGMPLINSDNMLPVL